MPNVTILCRIDSVFGIGTGIIIQIEQICSANRIITFTSFICFFDSNNFAYIFANIFAFAHGLIDVVFAIVSVPDSPRTHAITVAMPAKLSCAGDLCVLQNFRAAQKKRETK
ncbi:hypothetical protein GQX74_000300 [Glossina fuscipes]|nr:hypothetical protein GQX74_000300 [Glossina fuscipes]